MCIQYRGGYLEYCGGYPEYLGGMGCSVPGENILSTVGDIMIHVGDIMSTVEDVQYSGGTQITDDSPPRYSWYHPYVSWYPHSTQDIPHDPLPRRGTEHTLYRVSV